MVLHRSVDHYQEDFFHSFVLVFSYTLINSTLFPAAANFRERAFFCWMLDAGCGVLEAGSQHSAHTKPLSDNLILLCGFGHRNHYLLLITYCQIALGESGVETYEEGRSPAKEQSF